VACLVQEVCSSLVVVEDLEDLEVCCQEADLLGVPDQVVVLGMAFQVVVSVGVLVGEGPGVVVQVEVGLSSRLRSR
jgi:hypothetical protein